MEQITADDPIRRLREENRAEVVVYRKEDRDARFKQQRLCLQEVKELIADITIDEFKELVLRFKEKNPSLDTIKAIKNNCCTSTRAEAFFRTDGAFEALISIFIGKNANKQLEAAACLTNLACGSHKAAQRIIKRAGPYLVCFIGSGSCYLQDQCAWAVGNLADDCFDCFSLLKVQGIMPVLFTLLKSPSKEVIKSAVHALHACTKYGDPELGSIIFADSENLKNLLSLLQQNDVEKIILHNAAFTLSNICYLSSQHFEVSNEEIQIILNCLHKSISNCPVDISIALPMTRCLGFMTTRYEICHYLSEHSMFNFCATQIFRCEFDCLKVEFLWILTNIAVSGKIVLDVINMNSLLKILDTSLFFLDCSGVQVLYYLSTLATKSEDIIKILQQDDIIQRISPFLICGEKTLQQAAKTFFCVIRKQEFLHNM
ncbi:uncharacterized protein LOC129968608 isoform X1 [Argiope bruennichi]|uniref:uncharacterized protein LOC129968608 isoform X1 n=1 Tax=Argiope bruennichi TaxID=94029 RepID=UPI0024947232|nr:uncharacterized protein LOC129968608 isoform X1 [Argiope bruennichi]